MGDLTKFCHSKHCIRNTCENIMKILVLIAFPAICALTMVDFIEREKNACKASHCKQIIQIK